jgi:hypothetical protein
MDDLATWLLAQLDDEERAARAVQEGFASYDGDGRPSYSDIDGMPAREAEHIARWDPARVLAEVDVRRRILELYGVSTDRQLDPTAWELMKHAVRALALPYADRPGYREEWRP